MRRKNYKNVFRIDKQIVLSIKIIVLDRINNNNHYEFVVFDKTAL